MAAKIMLVEDDTNLSEIYKARLEAEGFQILSAKDGEEALAMAVRERPDLIICDIMMPKISGFDMLDILRGTDGIKDTRVIMMTALGQSEDKARAEKLGADRYLVKSQVTLEDVVKTVHDVLEDNVGNASANQTTASAPVSTPIPEPNSVTQNTNVGADSNNTTTNDLTVAPNDASSSNTVAARDSTDINIPSSQSTNMEQSSVQSQIQDFLHNQEGQQANDSASATDALTTQPPTTATNNLVQPVDNPTSTVDPTPTPSPTEAMQGDDNTVNVAHKKVLQPPSNLKDKPDLASLLAKEEANSSSSTSTDGIFSPTSIHPDNHRNNT